MQFRGKVGHAGIVTANGRLYGLDLMKREIESSQDRIINRGFIGETDHPGPTMGGPTVRQSSIIFTGLEINETGEIFASGDVVETSAGKDLAALIRAGAQVGMSSRGSGTASVVRMTSTHPAFKANRGWEGKEVEEVNVDYKLRGFDAVIGQAVSDAYIDDYTESQEVQQMDFEQLKKLLGENKELLNQVVSYAFDSELGKAKLQESIDESKEEVDEESIKSMVKNYLISDEFTSNFKQEENEDDSDEVEKIKCEHCEAMVEKESKFCSSCGRVVTPVKEEKEVDDKDQAIEDLKKDLEAQKEANQALADEVKGMKKEKEDQEEKESVDKIISEVLEGKPSHLVEAVREDISEMKLTSENAKETVEKRYAKFEAFQKKVGGSVSGATGHGKVIHNDGDSKKNINESDEDDAGLKVFDSLY